MTRSYSLALCLSVLAGPVLAGANAGGTLIFHANPGLTYTQDHGSYIGESGLSDCANAITRVDGETPFVFYALAAFPPDAVPCLKGVEFGIDYDDQRFSLLGYGSAGDLEIHSDDWPAPNSSTAIAFGVAREAHLVEVYWFAGYALDTAPSQFTFAQSLNGAPVFGDCDIPAFLDPVSDFGILGLNTDGVSACPSSAPVQGACCLPSGECVQNTEDGCATSGGSYLGDDLPCVPNPCAPPPAGACCMPDGQCVRQPEYLCQGEGFVYQGDGTVCDPNPCDADPVAVDRESWGAIKQRYRSR